MHWESLSQWQHDERSSTVYLNEELNTCDRNLSPVFTVCAILSLSDTNAKILKFLLNLAIMTKSKPKLAFAKYIYETVIYDNRGIECQRLLFGYSMRSDNRDIIGVYDEKNDRVVIMLIHHAAFYYIPPKADKIKHVYATPYSYMKISMVWLPSGQLWLLGGKRTNVRLIQMGYSRHYPFTKATQLVDIV